MPFTVRKNGKTYGLSYKGIRSYVAIVASMRRIQLGV